jgi:DNA-binding NarL/FixJ family response regulator
VLDPEVVTRMLARPRHENPIDDLSPRERDVLELMAQGRSNQGIAEKLWITESAVEKHVNAIFDKLGLAHVTGYSRRVLAVLRYLDT